MNNHKPSHFSVGMALGGLMVLLALVGLGASTWVSSSKPSNYATSCRLVTVTTNALAFSPTDSPITPGAGEVESSRSRTLQNAGTVPVLYLLTSSSTDYCSATNYHGILAAGTVARDGLGSVVSLGDWRGYVSVAVESGTGVVSTLEVVK